jgi:hypothetical protein
MHVLVDDDRGRLTLRRLGPWPAMLARSRAARLDRELAGGASPETSAALAARAMRLTSMEFRRGLAASLQRILAAAGEPVVPRPQPPTGRSSLAATDLPTRPPLAATDLPTRSPLAASDPPTRPPLAATARPPRAVTARPPRVPLRLAQISQSAPRLAALVGQLVEPGPVPARGVAMLSQLLADGTGPLYREASRDDLGATIEAAARALTL